MTNQIDPRDFVLNSASQNNWVIDLSENAYRNKINEDHGKEFLFRVDAVLKELDHEGIINKRQSGNIYDVTSKGQSIHRDGGFSHQELLSKEKGQLELDLAKSNIRANELNEQNSKMNYRNSIINIAVGVLNAGLLVWQILQAG